MDRKGFSLVIFIVIFAAIIFIASIWYYAANNPFASAPSIPAVATSTLSSDAAGVPACDQDYATSSLASTQMPIVGAWHAVRADGSLGDDIEFTNSPCGNGFAFRSYRESPVSGVSQPFMSGVWSSDSGTVTVVDEADLSSPGTYIFSRFTVSTTTLVLYDNSAEKYSRILIR